MHAALLCTLQTGVAGNVVKVNSCLDGKAQPHAQTAFPMFTVALYCGHTFVVCPACVSVHFIPSYVAIGKSMWSFPDFPLLVALRAQVPHFLTLCYVRSH